MNKNIDVNSVNDFGKECNHCKMTYKKDKLKDEFNHYIFLSQDKYLNIISIEFDTEYLCLVYSKKISSKVKKLYSIKPFISKIIAIFIYLLFFRIYYVSDLGDIDVCKINLSDYRKNSFYFIFKDSFDKFITKIESLFSKLEVKKFNIANGLKKINFSKNTSFYFSLGFN